MVALGVIVYRIQTDQGELIITSKSDDVEVVVKQGGHVVRVIDTKTDRSIMLRRAFTNWSSGGASGAAAGCGEGDADTWRDGAGDDRATWRSRLVLRRQKGPSSWRFSRRSTQRTVRAERAT